MMESLHFIYDGISSSDMGIVKINASGGLFEEQFVAPKTVKTEKIKGRDNPYFYGVERDVLSFFLELWFEDGMSEDKRRQVATWLDQDIYKPMSFDSNYNRIFYAMSINDSSLFHNGIEEGYLKIDFTCDSPYSYSPLVTQDFDLSLNTSSGTNFSIMNAGDVLVKPIIEITMQEDGDIEIINISDNNKTFILSNNINAEVITVDNENEELETSRLLTYRYDDHNDIFLSLLVGENNLQVTGKCKLTFKYYLIYKQG